MRFSSKNAEKLDTGACYRDESKKTEELEEPRLRYDARSEGEPDSSNFFRHKYKNAATAGAL